MRCLIAGLIALTAVAQAQAGTLRQTDLVSSDAVLRWINVYREHPDAASVPVAMQSLSRYGAFDSPERAGVYVGFLAGVLTANPAQAEEIAARTLTVEENDRWIVVRAIAYSGLPNWRALLRRVRLPHAALRRAERPLHHRQDGDACRVRGAAEPERLRARPQRALSRQGVRPAH